MRLSNKIAIVTGAASGFGAEIARRFVAEGAQVVIADINESAARDLASELGERALGVHCDVSSGEAVSELVAQTCSVFGDPDIVVNNAGVTHKNGPMLDIDEETFDRIFNVNVKAVFHMAKAVVPIMRSRGSGVILNVGSVAGIRPRPGLTWYNASKGAVNVLSKSMAAELGPDKIRVNAICPVLGVTGLLEAFMGAPDTPENRARFLTTIPLGRLAEGRDVANAALFLASDEADFITGLEMPVDGGRSV